MPGPIDSGSLRDSIRREVEAMLKRSPAPAEPDLESTATGSFRPTLVTEKDVAQARSGNRKILTAPGAIVTPLARDSASRYGVEITDAPASARVA